MITPEIVDGAADAPTVDGGEHGEPGLLEAGEAVLQHQGGLAQLGPAAARLALGATGGVGRAEHGEVHAGAEVATRRREHHRPHVTAGVELAHDRGQLVPELADHRVELVGTAHPHVGDPVGHLHLEAAPAHRRKPASSASGASGRAPRWEITSAAATDARRPHSAGSRPAVQPVRKPAA